LQTDFVMSNNFAFGWHQYVIDLPSLAGLAAAGSDDFPAQRFATHLALTLRLRRTNQI